jgi:hypothetical protein
MCFSLTTQDRLCERGRAYLRDFFLGTAARRQQLDLDNMKKAKEEARRIARLKKFPRPPGDKEKKKFVKSEMEAMQEKTDRTNVLNELKVDVMAAVETEFYKYAGGVCQRRGITYLTGEWATCAKTLPKLPPL